LGSSGDQFCGQRDRGPVGGESSTTTSGAEVSSFQVEW
jgi:hypothetical protein